MRVMVGWLIVTFNTWLPVPAAAQEKPQPDKGQQPGPVAAATFVDYRVGPADELEIKVFGLDALDQRTRVSNPGKIHVPHLGLLTVNDKTTGEIEAEIARGLREKALVKNPWAQVKVLQYRARPVYLLGEVWTPGQFMITDRMTVLDLLTLGNGTSLHRAMGFLYRRKAADGQKPTDGDPTPTDEAIPIDFEALMNGRQANLELQGGDVLYVPLRKPEMFYVVGAVQRPGMLEIQPRQPLLVSQAVAMAGGLLKTAKGKDGMVLRYDDDGTRREMPVNITAVLSGKAPDFPVRADDIIFVPGSAVKNLGYGLLNLTPMVVSRVIIPF